MTDIVPALNPAAVNTAAYQRALYNYAVAQAIADGSSLAQAQNVQAELATETLTLAGASLNDQSPSLMQEGLLSLDNSTFLALSNQASGAVAATLPPAAAAALSVQQTDRLITILAPLANAPLTPNLVAQIQAQLEQSGINPLQVNLSTILLVMNYIALFRGEADQETPSESEPEEEAEKVIPMAAAYRLAA